jgi:hypothetical protein
MTQKLFMRSEIMKRRMIITFILALVLILCVCNVQAEITWDGGHHIFSEGSEDYVYMYNEASADIIGGDIGELYMYDFTESDITGGHIGALLCDDSSYAYIHDSGSISLIRPNHSSVVDIYDGTINDVLAIGSSITNIYGGSLYILDARESSIVNLYTIVYDFDPSGGFYGAGLLTGEWIGSGASFSINFDEGTIDHVNFVPEPGTVCLFSFGGLVIYHLRRKRYKRN